MSLVAVERAFPVSGKLDFVIVIIDSRVLFRESLIFQTQKNDGAPNVLGFCSVTEWQNMARECPPVSVIVVSAEHRSVQQMKNELTAIAATSPGVPLIMLSELEDYQQVCEAMLCGLSGFIPMSSSVQAAQSAIAFVVAGGRYVPANITSTHAVSQSSAPQSGGSARLTVREAAVLSALQIGKPNKVIAYDLHMCTNTVKVHVRNLMRKLQAKNRTELAYLANTKHAAASATYTAGSLPYTGAFVRDGMAIQPSTNLTGT
jgi:DNA-binding NarL/FixJ family response regulator